MPSTRAPTTSAAGPTTSHAFSFACGPETDPDPYSIRNIIAPTPMKITASSARAAPAIQGWPPAQAARTIVNSLKNIPNGGDPVTANIPRRSNTPDTGTVRRTPPPDEADAVSTGP